MVSSFTISFIPLISHLASPPPSPDIDEIEKSSKDEGYIPWAMGWVHTATNFVLN